MVLNPANGSIELQAVAAVVVARAGVFFIGSVNHHPDSAQTDYWVSESSP